MELGKRMKEYEQVSRFYLTKRTPVIIRIDGRAFHSFTKGLKKPFDDRLMDIMQQTMLFLCDNIQGCKIGYTQSDEISLLITDFDNIESSSWFNNNLCKFVSISASLATQQFNKLVSEFINKLEKQIELDFEFLSNENYREITKLLKLWEDKEFKATFDSRAFNLPKEEVCNYFIWRQQDATRNAIQSAGQSEFSYKELNGKKCNEIQEMLFTEKGINFNNYNPCFKRGSCAIKTETGWVIDKNIPIFTQDRTYIDKYLTI